MLMLISGLSVTGWTISRLSLKAAHNINDFAVAKEAAYIALVASERNIKYFLTIPIDSPALSGSKPFLQLASKAHIFEEMFRGKTQFVPIKAVSGYAKNPRYTVAFLGNKHMNRHTIQVKAEGWGYDATTYQAITALYVVTQTGGQPHIERRGLYFW